MSGVTMEREATPPADERTINIIQGEQRVDSDPRVKLVTLLGSCVAACLHDPIAGVGGMNHFLLPGDLDAQSKGAAERYAVHAMELLVNALLKRGASCSRLEAKLFGGAATVAGLSDVGAQNARFALDFLRLERITVLSQCLGGKRGRRIQFWPASGRARRIFMESTEAVNIRLPTPIPMPAADIGALELF